MMTEGTVADALAKAGVSIDDDDLISHPMYEFLEENERIFINRIDYRTMSYEEEIPYEVETEQHRFYKMAEAGCCRRGRPVKNSDLW